MSDGCTSGMNGGYTGGLSGGTSRINADCSYRTSIILGVQYN